MTLKEAVLKSLEELNEPSIYMDIYNHIVDSNYFDFGNSKTPYLSVSGVLTDLIQKNDTRIKRIKRDGRTYSYYLTKNEQDIDIEILAGQAENTKTQPKQTKNETYGERDLHKLLSSYLKNTKTYSKTIYHEHSKNGKDNNQIWTHPDMVSVKF